MAGKVVINLATGLEDAERVTVAFLVGGAAVEQGKTVNHVLDQGGSAPCSTGIWHRDRLRWVPPVERLVQQYADGGGELLVCPICFSARKLDDSQLVPNAKLGGATPLWEWIGDEDATVFSY
jgi:predicted peroxiredoxin